MKPEHVVIDLIDGSTLEAMLTVAPDGVHIAAGFLGTFILRTDSVRAVAYRILELILEDAPKIRERTQ